MANISNIKEMAYKLNLVNISKLEDFNTKLPALDYLEYLLKYELDKRVELKIEENKKLSKLPKVKIKKSFEGITNWNINELKKLIFLEDCENLLIWGKCGSGKTGLGVEIAEVAIDHHYKVRYILIDEILDVLRNKDKNEKQRKTFESLKSSDLIIIDEMMYLPISDIDLQMLYRGLMFLNDSRSIIFITNRRLSEWSDTVQDKHLMETFISRLIVNTRIIATE